MSEEEYVKRVEFNRLDERVTTLDIRQTRTEVRADHIEQQMADIKANTTWTLRLIIGAIITAILGFLFTI